MTADEIQQDVDSKMNKTIEAVHRELTAIRTGRASPSLVERITAEYYGVPTPVNQMANISVPEPRQLLIQPWDRKQLAAIEKAIQKSDLNLTPTNDGTSIRIIIPPLTEDRRKDMVKVLRKKLEEGKVAIRNCRRDGHDHLVKLEKEKQISEDELRWHTDKLQKLTDRFIGEIDHIGQAKEAEILEV